jgi:hypothetical protein
MITCLRSALLAESSEASSFGIAGAEHTLRILMRKIEKNSRCCATAIRLARTRVVGCLLGSSNLHELVVQSKNQERGGPLADKGCVLMVPR